MNLVPRGQWSVGGKLVFARVGRVWTLTAFGVGLCGVGWRVALFREIQ